MRKEYYDEIDLCLIGRQVYGLTQLWPLRLLTYMNIEDLELTHERWRIGENPGC